MCPGDKRGFIAPFFFHEIRNKNTGGLIAFPKHLPLVVEEQSSEAVEEVELPPSAGAIGFERGNNTKWHIKQAISGATNPTNELEAKSVSFQDRLFSIYNMDSDVPKKRDYIRIADEWNSSPVIPQSSAENGIKHEVRTLESTTRHQMESEITQPHQPEVFRIKGGSREQRDEFHS